MNRAGKNLGLRLLLGGLIFTLLALSGKTAAQNPSEMQRELDVSRKLNDRLKQQLAVAEATLAQTRAVTAKAKAENDQLKSQNDQLRKELARLQQQVAAKQAAAVKITEKTAPSLQQEVEALRKQFQQLQAERDKNFRSVVELTDQLHKAFSELKLLRELNARLTALLPQPPKNVLEGLVTATQGSGLVEISLGSDDGLKQGHMLSVYRAKGTAVSVLGQIAVLKTAPDKAVCRVDPATLKGQIQKGDRVTTGKQPAVRAVPGPSNPLEPPLLVGGVVLAVLEDRQVEISFGSADGLQGGHRLEVYRETGGQGIYVGRIEVNKTGPNKSVCKIILEQDTVRKGDRITSKL